MIVKKDTTVFSLTSNLGCEYIGWTSVRYNHPKLYSICSYLVFHVHLYIIGSMWNRLLLLVVFIFMFFFFFLIVFWLRSSNDWQLQSKWLFTRRFIECPMTVLAIIYKTTLNLLFDRISEYSNWLMIGLAIIFKMCLHSMINTK